MRNQIDVIYNNLNFELKRDVQYLKNNINL